MKGVEEEEVENRSFSVLRGCSPPTFSESPPCGVAAALRAVARVSPDRVEVAPRAPDHSGYTDPQGCGVRDQKAPLPNAGLSSVLFNEEKFSQGSPCLVSESGPALGTAGSCVN